MILALLTAGYNRTKKKKIFFQDHQDDFSCLMRCFRSRAIFALASTLDSIEFSRVTSFTSFFLKFLNIEMQHDENLSVFSLDLAGSVLVALDLKAFFNFFFFLEWP